MTSSYLVYHYGNSVQVILSDETLSDIVEDFIDITRPINVNADYVAQDLEYWFEFDHDALREANELNVWLLQAVKSPADLYRLASQAANEIGNATLDGFVLFEDGVCEFVFCLNGQLTQSLFIPENFMDNAAENGQDYIEDDIQDKFFNFLVTQEVGRSA